MIINNDKNEPARYIIGIDLGTTNSAVAFVDTNVKPLHVEDFRVLQISAAHETSSLNLFPSFHYEAASGEFTSGALSLPWENGVDKKVVAGTFARDHGAQIPGRLVVSAKSWLSHAGVDRTAPLLPWHALNDVEKISPLEATSRYLLHMKNAWNYDHPDFCMENQDVIITVPASFDEIARELTVEAAANAGLKKIVLLEEPQAAFYAWIQHHTSDWQSFVSAGQKILICDIGGGTTDFTLIQAKASEKGIVEFQRIAVGDHLILGGDNLDLALAYYVEQKKIGGRKISPRQFGTLVRSCQKAKETLLGEDAPPKLTLSIQGSGTSLIGGAIQIELTKEEVENVLVEGYLPFVALTDKPQTRQSGFQEFGLPYAPDHAITKYLASFIMSHGKVSEQNKYDVRPDIVLFNGGVFGSSAIRKRIIDVLCKWFTNDDNQWKPILFENDFPERAVARGAAYFGLVRRGVGVRIGGGLARSYYIGVETDNGNRALCLAPAGLQEGQSIVLDTMTFSLLIRQPVEFPLFVSSRRTTDMPGELIVIDPLEMNSLPPICTVLRSGKNLEADSVKVLLNVRLTEIGTLDLWCSEIGGNRSWKLQFDVRSATRTEIAAHSAEAEKEGFVDNETIESCKKLIAATFSPNASIQPSEIIRHLEKTSSMERSEWPPSLLRIFWEEIFNVSNARGRDPQYEARWLNLLGFALRPGYGYAVDDWRVKQTWLLFQKGVIHNKNQACCAEWWILWRRIAGGLASGQQKALAQPLIAIVKNVFKEVDTKRKVKTKSDVKLGVHELVEIWRLLGSLEYLPSSIKVELGTIALRLVNRKDPLAEAAVWAIGRFGARIPVYGPLNEVVDPQVAAEWAKVLTTVDKPNATLHLSLMQLCRLTSDRYRDIDRNVLDTIVDFMKKSNAPEHLVALVECGGDLDAKEQNAVFGDSLPKGLRLL
jgi:molecular chaperone DnaK (HSP70)